MPDRAPSLFIQLCHAQLVPSHSATRGGGGGGEGGGVRAGGGEGRGVGSLDPRYLYKDKPRM